MSFDPTGYTLAHEHLHIDLSGFKNNVDCRLDQYAFICQEMNDLMTRGVRNVIEMTNRYMGRNAQFILASFPFLYPDLVEIRCIRKAVVWNPKTDSDTHRADGIRKNPAEQKYRWFQSL